jgi:L-2,4-diaminobutyrate decarboxylase
MTESATRAASVPLERPAILDAIEADADIDVGKAFAGVIAAYLADTRDRSMRVSTKHTPEQMAARFDEALPRDGRPVDSIVEQLHREIVAESNHLWHPRYVGHQNSGPLPAAIWTESVTAALNQSIAVFEMSPVGTILEHRVISWMCDLVGFPAGYGGTFTSGGTEATFTALLAARGAAMPSAWTDGVGDDPPLLLCGEHAHYAVTRAAAQLGLGMRNVRTIPSRGYTMDTAALELTLDGLAKEARRVMAVVATAGSTATGSIDDIQSVASLCDARGIWLHVDAAHGGSALWSARHRHRLRGIERARSVAWDTHKMMLMPSQAGMLLVRDERDLDAAFAQRAPYLFHDASGQRAWDQGTRSFMCTRRADVLKVWVALERYGARGMAELYDYFCALAQLVYDEISARDEFEALHEPDGNILCFRYVGDRTQSDAELDGLNRRIRERYNASGEGWITATMLNGRRVLRVTMMNPRTTAADVRAIIDGLAATAER